MLYIALEVPFLFGLCPSSSILKNTRFRELDLFTSSGEEMGGTYANLNWGALSFIIPHTGTHSMKSSWEEFPNIL
jgi:hypothetical protein